MDNLYKIDFVFLMFSIPSRKYILEHLRTIGENIISAPKYKKIWCYQIAPCTPYKVVALKLLCFVFGISSLLPFLDFSLYICHSFSILEAVAKNRLVLFDNFFNIERVMTI